MKGRANVLLRSNILGSFYAICAFENKLGKNRVNPNPPSTTLPHHIYPHQIPGLACGLAFSPASPPPPPHTPTTPKTVVHLKRVKSSLTNLAEVSLSSKIMVRAELPLLVIQFKW